MDRKLRLRETTMFTDATLYGVATFLLPVAWLVV